MFWKKWENIRIELVDKIDDPELKREYLLKLKAKIEQEPTTSRNIYNLSEIIDQIQKRKKEKKQYLLLA
jgi:hypothetical protein